MLPVWAGLLFRTSPGWQLSRLGDNFPETNFGWMLIEKEENPRSGWEVLQSCAGWSCDPFPWWIQTWQLRWTRRWWAPALCSPLPHASGQPRATPSHHGDLALRCTKFSLLSNINYSCRLALRIKGNITSCFVLPSGRTWWRRIFTDQGFCCE